MGGLGGSVLPAQALDLEIKTDRSTVLISDNSELDRDTQPGYIRYQGTVDDQSDSPFDIELQVQQTYEEGNLTLKLETPLQGAITNLGAGGKIVITVQSSPVELASPVMMTLAYRGKWSDVTDARQQINIPQNTWTVVSGKQPLREITLDPVASQGREVGFQREARLETLRPVEQVRSVLTLEMGIGDSLTLQEAKISAQGQGTSWTQWLFLGLGLLGLTLLTVGWLRRQARGGRT